jgi:hypothetical protein
MRSFASGFGPGLLILVCGLSSGCAQPGASFFDVAGSAQSIADVGSSDDGAAGGDPLDVAGEPDTQPTLDVGVPDTSSGDQDDGPMVADDGSIAADVPPDTGPADVGGDWDCEDDGVVDEAFGHCDWTWTCGGGSYVITCTPLGDTGLQCSCRKDGQILKKYAADEVCNAQSTVNLTNAVCSWELPLP